jgi:formate dehydrogenase assembly factor FdhD
MCTPELLEELAVGWLHGEGYIATRHDLLALRPCATDLGFWADVPPERVAAVRAENRAPVLASGCGAVSVLLADPATAPRVAPRPLPLPDDLRRLFKELFAAGAYETGGIHAPR